MKTWFTKFPFPGWIAIFLLLFLGGSSWYLYQQRQFSPENLADKVQSDFTQRERQLGKAKKEGLFSFPIKDNELYALKNEFSTIFYKNSEPVFWNADDIPTTGFQIQPLDSFSKAHVIRLAYGVFYVHRFVLKDSNTYALALIPIAFQYPFSHKYFHSYFVADHSIPPDATIGNEGFAIKNIDGTVAFHLSFNEKMASNFKIDAWGGLLSILFLACFFIWVHKVCVFIGKRYKPIWAWLLLLLFGIVFNFLRIKLGYPAGFENAGFFSPKLLASGVNIHSFPDLFFYVFFDFWLYYFIVRYVPVRKILKVKNRIWQIIIYLSIVLFLLFELFSTQATNVSTLIIDSKISFVVNDFQHLTIYTFLGIMLMCFIVMNFILIISIVNDLLKEMFRHPIWQYLFFLVGSCCCILYLHNQAMIAFNATMLLVSIFGLILIKRLGLPVQSYEHKAGSAGSSNNYLWFVILCSWVTILIFYFNFSKERALRKVYANRQVQQNSALLDYSFNMLTTELENDHLLKTLWKHPSADAGKSINKYLSFHYFGGIFQKFQTRIYYYNVRMQPLFLQDTLDKALIKRADSLAGSAMRNGLVSLQNSIGRNMYWGMFSVFDVKNHQQLGYVGIDFSMDNSPKKSPTSMLLQPNNNPSDELYFNDYSYAVYKRHKLEAQSGLFTFPFRSYFNANHHIYTFFEHWTFSDFFYQVSPDELVVVHYHRNIAAGIISLFSYVLAIWLLLSGLLFLIKFFVSPSEYNLSWHSFNLTIRAKVNWTIMLTVFLSLIVVGGITVSFLKNRYQETKSQNLRNLMFYFGQSIVHFIENKKTLLDWQHEQNPNQYPELVYLLNALSGEQGLDINLYNSRGKLMATSQSTLLQKGYLSSFMNPFAFTALKEGLHSDWQDDERIGQLDYQSLYLPLRNKNDEIIAFLNLPYYASQSTLKAELSGILSTLINIYMLIFFIAGISALLISNSIVRSYYLLIEQFRKIRLEHNVLIHWPYRDELGLLVTEYNNMILKVERMATSLASSEREAAWRELALQIAHEIKNPLTPMKLNIQYLRKAIHSGHQDISALVERISDTMIEQIENLNLIATEFALFARMPEAKPEVIHVSEHLASLQSLYQKDNISISLKVSPNHLTVWMDKSYFIRIFTNLIKNAIQSIPENRIGDIQIMADIIEDKKMNIVVKDNGNGIPPEIQKKIFTPYFTTKSSGTGIGLAMTKNMVEQSGGRIGFETTAGKGTFFYVHLPVYSEKKVP